MTSDNNPSSPSSSSSSPADFKRGISSGTFITKLWIMLNDSSINNLIRWSVDGRAICIPDVSAFSKDILPQYFKHNNWSSFIRQLNLYEFRRVNVAEPTGENDPRQTITKASSSSSSTHQENNEKAQERQQQRQKRQEQDDTSCNNEGEEDKFYSEAKISQLHQMVANTEKKCSNLSHEAEALRMVYDKQQELLSLLLDSVNSMAAHVKKNSTSVSTISNNHDIDNNNNNNTSEQTINIQGQGQQYNQTTQEHHLSPGYAKLSITTQAHSSIQSSVYDIEPSSTLNLRHPPVVTIRPESATSDPPFEQTISKTIAGSKRRSTSSIEELNNTEQLHSVLGEMMLLHTGKVSYPA
ncbi:HSF-type DNA-binding-domain-containing protein [Circinella umbellata]|nr:HSF-type DNA-binding-domain-containing protein [Circinella umbellata]